MKKIITLIIVAGTFASFSFASNFSSTFKLNDEAYISDIPFNTELIFNTLMNDPRQSVSLELTEESYIDDIPFDTQSIYSDAVANKTINPVLSAESYVDDIPFSTEEVVKQIKK